MDLQKEPGSPAILLAPGHLSLGSAGEWLSSIAPALRSALDIEGAIMIRGLPITSAGDFGLLRDALISERAQYREKATPRTTFGDDVFSSTNFPADQRILPHNENSYTLSFPGLVLFGCLVAAEEGGATPVTDCRKVLRCIDYDLVRRFREVGWALVRNYSGYFGLNWQTAFDTDDRSAVLRYCETNTIGATWETDDRLRTVQRRSAIVRHPRLADEVWFNHVAFWNVWSLSPEIRDYFLAEVPAAQLPFNTLFGDGAELTADDVAELVGAYDAATVREPWRPGDLMLVDNLLTAHGRDPYRGARNVLVAMGEVVALADCAPTVAPRAGFAPAHVGEQL